MSGDATSPEAGSNFAKQLDSLFEPWNRTDAPGLTVGVAKGGVVIYRRGFGMASLETYVANAPNTRMRLASITKHFAALLALLLAEEGLLDLDASIRTYIPELVGLDGEPSLRLLLQHRGGSRCSTDLAFIGHGMATPPVGTALATQMRQAHGNFTPGEAMIYNNGGYHLVSVAIERVGGATFAAQLKQRLFDPVGMVDTALEPSDYDIIPGVATMHVPLANGQWRRGIFPSEEVLGSGGIISTIDDMLLWTAHLRSRDRFGSPASWTALTERPTYEDGAVGTYALGMMIDTYRGVDIVHHAGGWIGGSGQMLTVPSKALDVVILANGAPGAKPVKLAEQVMDLVLAGELGEPASTIAVADYPALLGDWWSPDTGLIYNLVDEAGAVALSMFGSPWTRRLERRPGGLAVAPPYDLGEIGLELEKAAGGGELTVHFGGRAAPYHRVSEATANPMAFAQLAIGVYHSPDGDCTARVVQAGKRLSIEFADPFGRYEAELCPLGESVASIRPASPLIPLYAALTLDRRDGAAAGFRLNTGRTRSLAFHRT